MVVLYGIIFKKVDAMANEIIPYKNTQQEKKKSFLNGILGFLLCLKTNTSQPAYQEIQSIHHVLPREEILRQMIDLFITNTQRPALSPHQDPCQGGSWQNFFEERAAAYSEAMSGAPVCALVKTPTDAWLVAITRTVKLRWPEFVFESKPKMYERHNLDDYEAFFKKQLQTREYEILRDTEGWKAIISPFKDKKLDLMSGYMFQWKGDTTTGLLKQSPLSEKSQMKSARLFALNVPNLLRSMQTFHSTIEEDKKKKEKYLSCEMYSRPEDYNNIVRRGHMTEYIFSGGSLVGLKGRYFWEPGLVAHGVENNFNGLYPMREISFKEGKRRFVIPPPKNGERLVYKAEEKFYIPMRKTPELE